MREALVHRKFVNFYSLVTCNHTDDGTQLYEFIGNRLEVNIVASSVGAGGAADCRAPCQ